MKPAYFLLIGSVLFISACGGGGGSSDATLAPAPEPEPEPQSPDTSYQAGVYRPSEEFKDYCEAPRSGTDPQTGAPYADVEGSVLTENHWLRSWSDEFYLWYDEIDDQNPAGFSDPLAYFDTLKTLQVNPDSGNPKDRFHYALPTDEWLQQSQSGVVSGYGMSLRVLNSTPPRYIVVQYVEPDSPADLAGIRRGHYMVTVDGADAINADTEEELATVVGGVFPESAGELHEFEVAHYNDSAPVPVSMTSSDNIVTDPVIGGGLLAIDLERSPPGGRLGYLRFNSHIATAEEQLVEAFGMLQEAEANDLVLDLRYNGGGYLAMASQVAYMIAGPQRTQGRVFETQVFNDKHSVVNPFTGDSLEPMPFINQTLGFDTLPPGQTLPSLDLDRVFILTAGATCSASESIINGLRGVGVDVIIIGFTTCGKPYGFYPVDNCGTTYFSIHFRGENDQGFGDYSDGFSPSNLGGGVSVAGCAVVEDFSQTLGATDEELLSAAIDFRFDGSCPASPTVSFNPNQTQLIQTSWQKARDQGKPAPAPVSISNRILGVP